MQGQIHGVRVGIDAQQIANAPRYHHQYLPDQVEFEPGALTDEEQARLTALGQHLHPASSYGNMHTVWWDKARDALTTGSDPRGVGTGAVKRQR